ncbi:hypothetical protein ACFQRL_04470 [Microbacterium fluvii]|uniref:Uncharacterized protein n=2 Tax=Microbacterium fluvii TaxID=415215 RepID=A0ABW2HA62_9MICO|nr:hypothetical protein [Microbacterium fluvii]MCU4671846.1 hypothetical protein [Microbacterium fluvii]
MSDRARRAEWAWLKVIAWFNLVSAMIGAVGLIGFGGMGIPLEWLHASPFTTYVWPGVILGVVVGGSQALALLATHGRYRLASGMNVAAGLVMMTWIFVEIAMMLVWSPLQGIYFAAGLIQVTLAALTLGAWPSPLFQRGSYPVPQRSIHDSESVRRSNPNCS